MAKTNKSDKMAKSAKTAKMVKTSRRQRGDNLKTDMGQSTRKVEMVKPLIAINGGVGKYGKKDTRRGGTDGGLKTRRPRNRCEW